MRNSVNVFITDNSVLFVSQNLTLGLSFEEQSMRQISEELIATLINNKLKELELSQSECVFVLSEDYYSVQTSVESFTKRQNNDNTHQQLTYKSYFKQNASKSEACSEQSEFLFQGKRILDYSALPLLQNYYVRKTTLKNSTQKYTDLMFALKKLEIKFSAVIPFSEFASFTVNKKDLKRGGETVIISFHKRETHISVYRDNYIQHYNKINHGFSKILEDVSNQFNVSLKAAKRLIELYGYVFLPKKYINFVIEVPVYDDICVDIKLTELSYCIRESLRNMIANLLQETNVSSNVNFVFYSDTEIREFSKLVGLMLNADAQDLSLSQLNYQTVSNSILAMADFEEASVNITEMLVEENICAENEKCSIKEKISGLINMRVKPWLLESENCNR